MPELKMDLDAPNRFISSLSKSLQALCHGCMEFDSGIEIMGYININIDSGNKMDYVLNEKVMKSNTNSMTFVSNSFVALKDKLKQTIDGSCSPIPELQPQLPSFHQTSSGLPHQRSSFSHSSHSQVLQGAQKRAWSGMERDWKSLPQKHPPWKHARRARPAYARVHNTHQFSESQSSSHTYNDSNISQTQLPVSQSYTDASIKQEVVTQEANGEEGRLQNTEQFSVSGNASSNGANVDVNIKSEPGSLPVTFDTTNTTEVDSNIDSKSCVLGNFLEGGKTQTVVEQSQGTNHTLNEFPSFDFPPCGNVEVNPNMSEKSEVPVEYNETHGDITLPGTSFGDESRDDSQFDIIEIDDEDGDASIYQDPRDNGEMFVTNQWNNWPSTNYNSPMMLANGDNLDYVCSLCGKGFKSYSGLWRHKALHKGQVYRCHVCDKEFTQKGNLNRHLKYCHHIGAT